MLGRVCSVAILLAVMNSCTNAPEPSARLAASAPSAPLSKIGQARVGQQTDYDKLTLEHWTNLMPRGFAVLRDSEGRVTGISTCRQPSTRSADAPPARRCGEILLEGVSERHEREIREWIATLLDCIDDTRMPRKRYRVPVIFDADIDASGKSAASTAAVVATSPAQRAQEVCISNRLRDVKFTDGHSSKLHLKLSLVSF